MAVLLPTLPRSWCSWARPKRSAPSTIITVALGTSMPTSMRLVETSTSTSPRLKAAMTASRSAALSWPWTTATLASRNGPACRRSASATAVAAAMDSDSSMAGQTT